MLKVEATGHCSYVVTRNVLQAEKNYVAKMSKTRRDRALVTTKREQEVVGCQSSFVVVFGVV